METKQKIEANKKHSEFLRQLRKRMKELEKEEDKFRDLIINRNKLSNSIHVKRNNIQI